MVLVGWATPFLIGEGGWRLEEPVELAVVEESLFFFTTLALETAEAADSLVERSFLVAESVGACLCAAF